MLLGVVHLALALLAEIVIDAVPALVTDSDDWLPLPAAIAEDALVNRSPIGRPTWTEAALRCWLQVTELLHRRSWLHSPPWTTTNPVRGGGVAS